MTEEPNPLLEKIIRLEAGQASVASDVAHFRQMVNERAGAAQKALDVALAASDRRLDLLNEFRASYGDLVASARVKIEAMVADHARLSAETQALRERVDASGKPNPLLLVSLASVIFALIAASWFIIGLEIDTRLNPLMVRAEISRVDRGHMDERLKLLEAAVTANVERQALQDTVSARLRDQIDALTGKH